MSVTIENYDQLKIDKIKLHLQSQAEKGNPRFYEIFVDNLKAVQKTNDVAEFDSYEDYMTEDTEKIRILIYSSSSTSPRNDQYTYRMKKVAEVKNETSSSSLNGLEIEARIEEKLQGHRERWEHEQLRKELDQTKKQLEEAESYSEKLEAELVQFRSKKLILGNVNLGELASVVVEGFVRRNPQILAKIPGAEGLAGVIEQDNKDKANATQNPAPDTTASFKKAQEETAEVLTEEEKGYLQFMKGIAENFDQQEITILTQIIIKLEEDPAQLKPVAELLNIDINGSLKTDPEN
jgi:hypothetical protein